MLLIGRAALFKNDLVAEWNKLDKSSQRPAAADSGNSAAAAGVSLTEHNGNTWPASLLIERLKTLIGNTIRDPASQLGGVDAVVDVLQRCRGTLLGRCDVTAAAFKCLLQLSFDFVFIVGTSSTVVDVALSFMNLLIDLFYWKSFHSIRNYFILD